MKRKPSLPSCELLSSSLELGKSSFLKEAGTSILGSTQLSLETSVASLTSRELSVAVAADYKNLAVVYTYSH